MVKLFPQYHHKIYNPENYFYFNGFKCYNGLYKKNERKQKCKKILMILV